MSDAFDFDDTGQDIYLMGPDLNTKRYIMPEVVCCGAAFTV